jgi:hypothetical protein
MARQRCSLTPAVEKDVLAFIRAGGFPHVAAEAAGVPRAVFERWLRQGQAPDGPTKYRAFFEAVQRAQAQARLGAEVEALKGKPIDWLKSGPGKETRQAAGWTAAGKAGQAGAERQESVLLRPEVQALIRQLLEALAPFPEARAAAAQALAAGAKPTRPRRRR